MIADLHTHSTASDGQYAPSELVRLAKDRGLQVLALTDHDTIDGLDEAVRTGAALGLRVLRGVELSAREYRSLHILGYGFSTAPSALTRLCAEMKAGRDQRKSRIIDFLHEKGVDISLAEVEELAGGDVIGRPHFAQVMVRRGYVQSSREAFDRYLDTDEYQRIERRKPDARACIEAIRSAGGKTSFAHPYQVKLPDDALEALVRELAGYGLDAIECYYPRHTAEQQALYLRLAEKYGLHATGGSDFHGERVKPDITLAAWELDTGWLLDQGRIV
ncbi:MAG: PHP domain-containing protein [Oscillospiraceae bacterium]|nr:PHP domain-containing protein [Oscillospiraceae bacterium]